MNSNSQPASNISSPNSNPQPPTTPSQPPAIPSSISGTPQSAGVSSPINTPSSPLAKSLKELGLQDSVIVRFDNRGYFDLIDLGQSESKVRETISGIDASLAPQSIDAIVRLWRQRNSEANQSKPLALPTLAPGTKVDLSVPALNLDGKEYEIPSALQQSVTNDPRFPLRTAVEFRQEEWIVLAKRNNLCYALNLDRSFEQKNNPVARFAALVWKIPSDGVRWLDPGDSSRIERETSYTASKSSKIYSRIVDGSFSIATPFVAGLAKVERSEKKAQAASKKRLYMTGKYIFPFAKLSLKYCTALSDQFIQAVKDALAVENENRFQALRKVFDDYGHVVPEEVTLGGMMFFSYERDIAESVNEEQVSTTIQAAVSAKYSGTTAEASASFKDASGKSVSASEMKDQTVWVCVGGDETLNSDSKSWSQTVKMPNSWRVIERKGLFPLTDLLEDSLRKQVLDVWKKGLEALWGTKPPADYTFPDFNGLNFRISKGLQSKDQVLTTDLGAVTSMVKHFLCVSYDSLMASNSTLNHFWRLIYTGETDGMDNRGLPLYWIVPSNLGIKTKSEVLTFLETERNRNGRIPFLCSSAIMSVGDISENSAYKKSGSLWACTWADFLLANNRELIDYYIRQNMTPEEYGFYHGEDFIKSMKWTIQPKNESASPNAYVIRNYANDRFMSKSNDPITDFNVDLAKDAYRQNFLRQAQSYVNRQPIALTRNEEEAMIFCVDETEILLSST